MIASEVAVRGRIEGGCSTAVFSTGSIRHPAASFAGLFPRHAALVR